MAPNAIFKDLKDRSVLITGGGSGIGASLTEGFVTQGARVAFVQRSDAGEFCDSIEKKHGARPLFIKSDVTDVAALDRAVQTATRAHGPVTVLVNNAANDQRHNTLETDEEFWDWSMAVNLKAYFFACKAVIPGMQKAGGGSIINFSSIAYMTGITGFPVYTTANSGINGMCRSLAREFGPDRIRVNALAPGWVMTPKQLNKWATPQALAGHMDRQCLKEHLQPGDIVDAVLFLASGSSRMMTGQSLVMDGGVAVTG